MSLAEVMLIPNLGASAPAPSYDVSYQAVLDRAIALGYALPSVGQRAKQNTLLLAIKSSGAWTKLDACWAFANDGSKEFGTLNWKAPTLYQATLVSTPTFTGNQGFTGDGVAAHVDTNFNCSIHGVQYTQNNACRCAWVHAAVAANPIDGCGAGGTNRMQSSMSTAQRINQGSANISAATDLSGTGWRAIHRTSSTNVELFVDTTQYSVTATSAAMTNGTQTVLKSQSTYSTNTIAFYGLGASLVAENTALRNAVNSYMTSL